MTQRARHPRGYVLLLTLLLLAIAAAALAGVCRAGLQKAVQAARAQDDLQRRWGTLSCRTALMPKAPAVFAASGPRALAETVVQLELGGQSMSLTFGDEQAKASVNLLLAADGQAGATRAVREVVQASGAAERVELRPMAPDESNDVAPSQGERDASDGLYADLDVQPLLTSWSQVFASASPDELLRRRGILQSMSSNLTCWGDGLLNVRRASRDAMLRVCDRVLTPAQVSKILAARDKDPLGFDLWDTIDGLELKEGPASDVQRLLTDESTTYSLWIVTRVSGRDWYHLAVADFAPNGTMTGDPAVYEW